MITKLSNKYNFVMMEEFLRLEELPNSMLMSEFTSKYLVSSEIKCNNCSKILDEKASNAFNVKVYIIVIDLFKAIKDGKNIKKYVINSFLCLKIILSK